MLSGAVWKFCGVIRTPGVTSFDKAFTMWGTINWWARYRSPEEEIANVSACISKSFRRALTITIVGVLASLDLENFARKAPTDGNETGYTNALFGSWSRSAF